MFKSFFKPKWQHANHQVRIQAVRQLSAADRDQRQLLQQLALEDIEAGVRIEAWRHLPDPDWALLTQAWSRETDAVLRTLLWQRLIQRIESLQQAPQDFDLPAWLGRQQDSSLWEHLALKANWIELRRQALSQIERESCLFDAVLQDSSLELRLLALARIDKIATLERLLKEARNKDKAVSKVLKERLQQHAEVLQRPQRLNEQALRLCIQLEALSLSSSELSVIEPQWLQVLHQWQQVEQQLAGELQAETRQRFERVVRQYTERQQQFELQQRARLQQQQWCQQQRELRAPLLAQLEQLEAKSDAAQSDEVMALLQQLSADWQTLPSLLNTELQPLEQQFSARILELQSLLAQQPKLAQRQQQLDNLQRRLAPWLDAATAAVKPLNLGKLKQWQRELAEPPAGSLLPQWQQLDRLLSQLIQQAEQQQQQHKVEQQQLTQRLQQLLSKLEQSIEQGKLKESQQWVNQLQKALTDVDVPELEQEFNRLKQRVAEWRDWQSWVATPRKQALCDVMEQLAAEPKPVLEQARLVQDARALWQQLGATEPQSAQSLWERFNQACTQAYLPCKAHFEQQSQLRAQARLHREDLCQQIEQYLQTPGQAIDWRQQQEQLKHWRQSWQQLGQTEPAIRKALNTRFYGLLQQLEQQRQQSFQQNLQAKQQLIAQAEQLLNQPDLQAGSEQLKILQQQWKSLGRSGQDKQLWLQFRTLCDQLFQLRDAARQQQQQQLVERRAACQQLLLDMAELLKADLPTTDLTAAWQEVQAKWQQLSADPKSQAKWQQQQQDFNQLLHRRQQQQRQAQRLAVLVPWQQAAKQLGQLVALVGQKNLSTARLLELEQQFDPNLDAGLSQRFQTLLQQITAGTAAVWLQQQQRALRPEFESLCLQLEILTGLSSPAEFAEQRLQQQLHNLSQKLKQGEVATSPLAAGLALNQQWLAVAGLAPELSQARFERANQLWLQQVGGC